MSKRHFVQRHRWLVNCCGSMLIAGTCSTAALAQSATTELEEVIVSSTASRVDRDGFEAPTPTTVVGADTIEQRGMTQVFDVLRTVPAFRASASTTTSGPVTRGGTPTVDLRGLGTVRTLLLIDGQRAVPTALTGISDLSLIPTMMIDRVEVVTGGVSAGWGSDAVAGVINLIPKKNFTGLQFEASAGQTAQNDNKETRLGLVAGNQFADGKGHFVLGVDFNDNKGIYDAYRRDWGRKSYAVYVNSANNGLPQRLILPDIYRTDYTLGGIIRAVSGGAPTSLVNTAFGDGGTPYAFAVGALSNGNAGQTYSPALANDPNARTFPRLLPLSTPIRTISTMLRGSYDFTDDLSGFVTLTYAKSSNYTRSFPLRTTSLTIQADNAYLPTSIRTQMPVGSTLTVGREFLDATGPGISYNDNTTVNLLAGLSGKLPGSWHWDASFQTGQNDAKQNNADQIIASRLTQAVDAVLVGTTIRCRDTSNGCVPFNIFGNGSPSDAAQKWIRGDALLTALTRQETLQVNVRGEPIDTWAGPVSLASGFEYRSESADQYVDYASLTNQYLSGPTNQKPLHGRYNVREVYAETVVPLLKDVTAAKALDFNGALRRTDYSTSGLVTTWKAGVVYSPIDALRVRATRSRDIRAPNLNELYSFATPSTPNNLVNPFQGGAAIGLLPVVTSGNPALKPEIGYSSTYGVVWSPMRDLSMSVDYYKINLKGAISALGNQDIIDQCYRGSTSACQLVQFSTSNPTQIIGLTNGVINFASYEFSGVDFEVSYRQALSDWFAGAPGELSFGLMGTRTIDIIFDNGLNLPTSRVNRAGEGGTGGGGTGLGRPFWTGQFTTTYHLDRLNAGLVVRYVSPSKFDNTYAEGVNGVPAPGGFTINDNSIPSRTYFDLNANYQVIANDDVQVQVFGVINNVLDTDPPFVPAGGGATNSTHFDIFGRAYKAGIRVKY